MNWFGKRNDVSGRVGGLRKSRYLRGRPSVLEPTPAWKPPTMPIMDAMAFVRDTDDQGRTSECGPYMVSNWCAAVRDMNGGAADDAPYDPHALYEAAGGQGDSGTTLEGCFDAAVQLKWIDPSATVFDVPDFAHLQYALVKVRYAWVGILTDSNWSQIGSDGVLKPGGRPDPNGGHAILAAGFDGDWAWVNTSWGRFGRKYGDAYGWIKIHRDTFDQNLMDCQCLFRDAGQGVVAI